MVLVESFLRASPESVLFFCMMVGVWVGRIKFGGFSLGNATAVLITAVIVGAAITGPLGLSYPPMLKTAAFALFVFAVGFHSGPQFFGSLGFATLTQVVFTVFSSAVGLAAALTVAHLLGFDKGTTIGLAAGALTQTALIGTALAALGDLGLPKDVEQQAQAAAAVSYALTYIFGTVGVIAFVGQIAPWLMRVDLKEAARRLEAELAAGSVSGAQSLAYRRFDARAYSVLAAGGAQVAAIEAAIGERAAIHSVRRHGHAQTLSPDFVLQVGDAVTLTARRAGLVAAHTILGPELEGRDLLEPADSVKEAVVITHRDLAGLTLEEVVARLGDRARGVYLVSVTRGGKAMPIGPGLRVMTGDIAELAGLRSDIERVMPHMGEHLAATERSDLAWLGFGVFGGIVLGALTLNVGGIAITLGGGGGILIAGLVAGWYNSRHPLIGRIPHQATRAFWDLGLAFFVAVLGLTAGPTALAALLEKGPTVLVAGIFVTMMPMLASLYFGRYVLRMDPVIVCGALAGSMTQDAAMLAASEVAESSTPVLGFTVPYAIANVLLTLLGPIIVAVV